MSVIALIPLRAGGKRIGPIDGLDKERAKLGNHPLMAYTIRWALDSGIFDNVVAVTASEDHKAMAEKYGAQVPFLRPKFTTRDNSPDIEWVHWIMSKYRLEYGAYDAFSILRVTSPFRTSQDIVNAWHKFKRGNFDSARTVTPVEQHPGKMWVLKNGNLLPVLPYEWRGIPWHSSPTQALPQMYVQTAGMEFAWTDTMLANRDIAGGAVMPFVVHGLSALDINTKYDWYLAEQAIRHEIAPIPESLK